MTADIPASEHLEDCESIMSSCVASGRAARMSDLMAVLQRSGEEHLIDSKHCQMFVQGRSVFYTAEEVVRHIRRSRFFASHTQFSNIFGAWRQFWQQCRVHIHDASTVDGLTTMICEMNHEELTMAAQEQTLREMALNKLHEDDERVRAMPTDVRRRYDTIVAELKSMNMV